MPLVKRAVEPVFISRATLDSRIKNELEGVVVNTLAGLIKQLSSVSKHAENLFGDLVNEANGIYLRTVALSGRVQGLQDRMQKLDAGGKEDSTKIVEDINANAFKSSSKEEQQILDRGTLPTALQEVYRSCNTPPGLSQFTPYRDDNKDGLKFYTDPSYFFELWVKDQTKQIEKQKKKRGKGGRKKTGSSKKTKVRAVEKKKYAGVDKEFMEHSYLKESPGDIIIPGTPPTTRAPTESYPPDHPPNVPVAPPPLSQAQLAAPTAPPPPPPPALPSDDKMGGIPPPPPPPPGPGQAPPPPPPPTQIEGSPKMNKYPPNTGYPPPPAPAPPTNFPAPPPPPPAPAFQSSGPPPPPPPTMPTEPGVVGEIKKPPPEVDQRSALLLAIEKGMQLRKVEKKDDKPSGTHANDVASILKRRIAFEVSDTESDEDDSEEEDSEWSN